jgi:outer membrane protein assembly factor BamB
MYVNHHYEFSGAVRFISRMAALLLLFLFFTIWWLSRSQISWRDRLGAIAVAFVVATLALFAADKSMSAFGMFLSATPIIVTIWAAWLAVARRFDPFMQRAGFCVLMILACGYFTLTRFEGLFADQSGQTKWRWTNTSEQSFLANLASNRTPHPSKSAKSWTLASQDSPEFRGIHRDGVVSNNPIATDWNERPPKLLWKKKVGPAWSGMILVDGHLVTQEQRDTKEAVVCYDATTGDELWIHEDPVRFEEGLSGPGPRATPTFAGDRIYSYGGKGNLNCLKAESGELIWSHDCVAEGEVPKADIPTWGYSSSPLVVDNLVLIFSGGASESVLAYKIEDGQLAWSCAGGKQSYSSPQLMTLADRQQIVMHDNAALRGIEITTGKQIWELPGESEIRLPMLQPHLTGNDTLVMSTEPDLVKVEIKHDGDKWTATETWRNNKVRAGFNDFVLHNDLILALDDGVLCCLDLKDGNRLWKKGRLGHGQMLLLPEQDLLLLLVEKGDAILLTADRAGYQELGRFKAIEGKTWNSPVLAGDRLFLRNGEEMAAYQLHAPAQPAETR